LAKGLNIVRSTEIKLGNLISLGKASMHLHDKLGGEEHLIVSCSAGKSLTLQNAMKLKTVEGYFA
jgi:hypothetical protein